jgi:hypothetical protein
MPDQPGPFDYYAQRDYRHATGDAARPLGGDRVAVYYKGATDAHWSLWGVFPTEGDAREDIGVAAQDDQAPAWRWSLIRYPRGSRVPLVLDATEGGQDAAEIERRYAVLRWVTEEVEAAAREEAGEPRPPGGEEPWPSRGRGEAQAAQEAADAGTPEGLRDAQVDDALTRGEEEPPPLPLDEEDDPR